MLPFDSLVRLRQTNQPELSGYIVSVLLQYLNTGTLTGFATNTGQLTGQFYPLYQNPSGYVMASQTGAAISNITSAVTASLQAWVSANYYPNTNPSNYVTSGSLKGLVHTTGNEQISGEKVFWNDIQVNGMISGVNGEYIDLGQSRLHDAGGTATLDWEQQQFIGNWSFAGNGVLQDNTLGRNYIDLNNGVIYGGGTETIDFVNRILFGNWNITTGLKVSGVVYLTGNQGISGVKTFYNGIDTNTISDVTGNQFINLANQTIGNSCVIYLASNAGYIQDAAGNNAIDFGNRWLINQGDHNFTTLDWQNQVLTGSWAIGSLYATNNIYVNNIPVLLNSNICFTTGDQNVSGVKTFPNQAVFPSGISGQGQSVFGSAGFNAAFYIQSNGKIGGQYDSNFPTIERWWIDTNGNFTFSTTSSNFIKWDGTYFYMYDNAGSNNTRFQANGSAWFANQNFTIDSAGNTVAATLQLGAGIKIFPTYINGVAGSDVINFSTYQIYDSNSNQSINWDSRFLQDTTNANSVLWNSRKLVNNSGTPLVDWSNSFLNDSGTGGAIAWSARILSGLWRYPSGASVGYVLTALDNAGGMGWAPASGGAGTIPNIVYTTGDQFISGHKVFYNDIKVTGRISGSNPLYIDMGKGQFYNLVGQEVWDWTLNKFYQDITTDNFVINTAGTSAVDTTHSQLLTTTATAMDWNNAFLHDSADRLSIQWNNRQLIDTTGNKSLDWNIRKVYSTGGKASFDWASETNKISIASGRIYNSTPGALVDNVAIDWGNAGIGSSATLSGAVWGWSVPTLAVNALNPFGQGGPVCISVTNRTLNHASTNTVLDWENQQILSFSATQKISIDWNQRFLYDGSGDKSQDYNLRLLVNSGNTTTLDWQNNIFSGTWNTLSGTLQVSGNNVVTANQTGGFIDRSMTGGFGAGAAAGVSKLTVTGISITGNVTFTGLNGIVLIESGQTIFWSGAGTGGYVDQSMTGNFLTAPVLNGITNINNTNANDVVIMQSGSNGMSRLHVTNGIGMNGIEVENVGLDLVDIAFLPLSNTLNKNNIRFEHRSGNVILTPNTGVGEFQFFGPDGVPYAVLASGASQIKSLNGITLNSTGVGIIITGANFTYNGNAVVTANQTGNFITNGQVNLSNVVYTTGTQTVAGLKSFVSGFEGTGLDFGNRLSADINNRILYDSSSGKSVDWGGRVLYRNSSTKSVDFFNGFLYDSSASNIISLTYTSRTTYDTGSVPSIDWGNRNLLDNTNTYGLNWNTRMAADAGAVNSIDWNGRNLFDGNGVVSLNYSSRQLYGNWQATGIFNEIIPSIFTGISGGALINPSLPTYASPYQNSPALIFSGYGYQSGANNGTGAIPSMWSVFSNPASGALMIPNLSFVHTSTGISGWFQTTTGLVINTGGITTSLIKQGANKISLLSGRVYNNSNFTDDIVFDWNVAATILSGAPWGWSTNILAVNQLNAGFTSGPGIISVTNRQLLNGAVVAAVDWGLDRLYSFNTGQTLSIDWNNRLIYDGSGLLSIDYSNRLLTNSGAYTTLDWQNRIFSGTWNTLSGTLQVSGNNVVTSNQTGGFIDRSMTGGFGGGGSVSIPVRSGNLQLHPAAAKLPTTGMGYIDGSNMDWEFLLSGSGINPSGSWQFIMPNTYSGNAQVTIFATCKTGQGGNSNTQFDVYALSIPSMGGTTVNSGPQFVNSGTIVWDNNMAANTARKINISLNSYTGFGQDQFTMISIARNNSQVTGNNATGFVAYVGGYLGFTSY